MVASRSSFKAWGVKCDRLIVESQSLDIEPYILAVESQSLAVKNLVVCQA